jgi:hypothetical protein
MRTAWIVLLFAAPAGCLLATCSSDPGATQLSSTLPPTKCAAGSFDAGRTIVITVDDVVDGFGGLGSRTPSDLTAGSVRVSVEADAENKAPVTVSITLDGTEVAVVRGVPAGSECAVDADLAAGHYVVKEGDRDVEFDLVAP